jgi:hypothetical protein
MGIFSKNINKKPLAVNSQGFFIFGGGGGTVIHIFRYGLDYSFTCKALGIAGESVLWVCTHPSTP